MKHSIFIATIKRFIRIRSRFLIPITCISGGPGASGHGEKNARRIGLRPILILVVLLSWPVSSLGLAPPSPGPDEGSPIEPEQRQAAKTPPDATPTDAERISRLQRAVDDSTRQIDELSAKLNDPSSEFQLAETAFSEFDRRLTEVKKTLEAPGKSEPTLRKDLEKELVELEPKHKLSKDRFDLAIRERKTLQQQIGSLQQKIQQDSQALKKLRGENHITTQPTAEATATGAAPTPAVPANAPSVPTELEKRPADLAAPAVLGPAVPAMNAVPTMATNAATEKEPRGEPAPELVEARQEAVRKETEAQNAQAEVTSVTERIGALQKSIELENRLFETSREKAENAQATGRTVYDLLQKKWLQGGSQNELQELQSQITEARERLHEAQTEIRERTDSQDRFQDELSELQAERISAMEEAQRRRADAAQAQKRVEHLESPLSPRNLWRWFLERGPRVFGIIVAMVGVLWFARLAEHRLIRLMTGRGAAGAPEDRENRARTLVAVFHSAAAVVVYAGGGLMILTEVGVNIIPLMGGAAVIGLAVAFGAQNLIRDYFNGFMILLENQYGINDVIKVGDVSGQVERISLRCTVLRGLDGTVHFVPNGEISRVSNMTHEWSRALFEIPVAYKEDADRVMDELVELAKDLRRDPDFRGMILEMPEMLGVDEFAESAVMIKFLIKTRPLKQWTVKRELLRRIKKRFDDMGIEIPFPHRTVYNHHVNSGTASTSLPGSSTQLATGRRKTSRFEGVRTPRRVEGRSK